MKNILTLKVESALGAIFISLLSIFLVSIMFIAMKNFESDDDIANASRSTIKFLSLNERLEIKTWVTNNNINIPPGKGFRYVIKTYPDKPWLEE